MIFCDAVRVLVLAGDADAASKLIGPGAQGFEHRRQLDGFRTSPKDAEKLQRHQVRTSRASSYFLKGGMM